ncbi:hypothetical protein QBC36DRAFT_370036 [Triangularia setosa]|uniref:Uncharacterized protein n=1 Tax=Triangularia setosa TaxID=2587417 RepID=A0AAN6WG59_9PEZI|nr:hypothetical protein QBC36DRAFT_370036 [Podospora setosa]
MSVYLSRPTHDAKRFTIVIAMHVAFNITVESSGISRPKDVTESKGIAEFKGIAESDSSTKLNRLSSKTDMSSVIMAVEVDQTHAATDDTRKRSTASSLGYQALYSSHCEEDQQNQEPKKRQEHQEHQEPPEQQAYQEHHSISKIGSMIRHSKTRLLTILRSCRPIIYTNGAAPYRVKNPIPEEVLGLAVSRWTINKLSSC